MAARYLVAGGSGNWGDTDNWSASSGGASGASAPGSSDDVFMDANSGAASITSGSCLSLDCTGFVGTLSLTSSMSVGGNVTLSAGMTLSGAGFFSFASTTTIISAGHTLNSLVVGGTASLTLGDALLVSGAISTSAFGASSIDTAGYSVTAASWVGGVKGSGGTFTLRTSTVTLTGTGTVWNPANQSVSAGTSTIVISNTSATAKTFTGGGKTYNDLTVTGRNVTITGSNTFATIRNDSDSVDGLTFTAGTTQTATGFTSTTGNSRLSSSGSPATLSIASGTIAVNGHSIKDSTASGGATFTAPGGTNEGGNTGWSFPALAAGLLLRMQDEGLFVGAGVS